MNKVSVLDCTLRDGGYVNDFNFSKGTIKTVINKLGQAHIDIIECGFIRDTEYDENRSVFSQVEQMQAAEDEDVMQISKRLIQQNRAAYEELAK